AADQPQFPGHQSVISNVHSLELRQFQRDCDDNLGNIDIDVATIFIADDNDNESEPVFV
ncbi:hypothetical protein BGZ58_004510, partial [Dissophora ornata]